METEEPEKLTNVTNDDTSRVPNSEREPTHKVKCRIE